MHRTSKSAFSLVELSIVLVILGLLVGGVLAGQSLIRAAELRSVSSDYSRYVAAVQTFRDKYFALPGDMTNATSFWNSAGGDGYNATCAAVASTTPATCNGNGNGMINDGSVSNSEMFRAWQHLANAGLIEGSYTGTAGAAGWADQTPGVNQANSKISSGGWTLWWPGGSAGWAAFGRSGNLLTLGANISTLSAYSAYPLLTAEEAWNIDSKIDDGLPASGKVGTFDSTSTYAPNCSASVIAASATYQISTSGKICAMMFWLQ